MRIFEFRQEFNIPVKPKIAPVEELGKLTTNSKRALNEYISNKTTQKALKQCVLPKNINPNLGNKLDITAE